MALPDSSTVITITAPVSAIKDVAFDVSYTITGAAPGAANNITTIPPSGCPTEADTVPWTTRLSGVTGTKSLTLPITGRWIIVVRSEPGEPASVRGKALNHYVDVT